MDVTFKMVDAAVKAYGEAGADDTKWRQDPANDGLGHHDYCIKRAIEAALNAVDITESLCMINTDAALAYDGSNLERVRAGLAAVIRAY